MKIVCSCHERLQEKNGKRQHYPEGEYTHLHDCEYVQKRNKLISKAESNVINRHGFNMPGARFTKLFAMEMDRLALEAKLV